VSAQLSYRAKFHRPLRKLGFNRAIGIEGIRHSINDAGFENCRSPRFLRRRGFSSALDYDRVGAPLDLLGSRRHLRLSPSSAARAGFGRPDGIKILRLGCWARRLGAEQEIEPRGLQSFHSGRFGGLLLRRAALLSCALVGPFPNGLRLRRSWNGLRLRRFSDGLRLRRAIRGECDLLRFSDQRLFPPWSFGTRNARTQPLDRSGGYING
jgi:hypothetical protein